MKPSLESEIGMPRIHCVWINRLTQGTRITRNLCYGTADDLFIEVNQRSFLIDNYVFLAPSRLRDVSQGGAYEKNLFTCVIDRPARL